VREETKELGQGKLGYFMKGDERIVQEAGGVGEEGNKHRIGGFSQRKGGI
jgi:hypothetical protein